MSLLRSVYVFLSGLLILPDLNGLTFNSSEKTSTDLPIEHDGIFDIIEQPHQLILINKQIAPNIKGHETGKSPAHIQHLLKLAAAEAGKEAAISAKNARKKSPIHLPPFLFNNDGLISQSNTQNIENGTRHNLFYERKTINEPSLPSKTFLTEHKDKEDDSQRIPQKKLRQSSLMRRLFKRLKGKIVRKLKSHKKRNHHKHKKTKPLSSPPPLIINNHNLTEKDALLRRPRRAVTAKRERIWDYGVIPYEIANKFTAAHKALFKQAMRYWENFTCIKFVERDPKVHPNYLYFTVKDCGCCSFVGKSGNGSQDISIGRDCEEFGIVLHELGHAIGFMHEHTRTDRDKHIAINKENILRGKEHNFNVSPDRDIDSLGLPYDYNSIMHYANYTFSKSTYLTTIQIVAPHDRKKTYMGQRIKLSDGDIAQANLVYKCAPCGRTFQQNSGHIVSPHFKYKSDESKAKTKDTGDSDGHNEMNADIDKSFETCEWRITATNGERIILQLQQVNLYPSTNCTEDYLEIRDGYWHKSPIIQRLCGNHTSVTIKSNSSRMLISYVNRRSNKGYYGFIADFEVVCGGDIFLTEDHRIDSPNYPFEYFPDKECIWRVTVPDNHQVAIKFLSFELEDHKTCIHDYLEIRDGNNSDAKLIGKFCGSELPPNIITKSNAMYLKFVSDDLKQKIGFSAVFMQEIDECKFVNHGCEHECINTLGSFRCGCFVGYELQANGRSCDDACGGIIDASVDSGVLNSPSWPDVYPISKKCVWEIVAPENHSVFLNFTHFDFEGTNFAKCSYDYLVIYSKLRDNRLKKIGVYCGQEIPPVINSEQNILRLEFFSDKSVQHTGFSAKFAKDINECSINNGGCQHYCRKTFGSYICSCRNGYTLHENRHNCTETKCKFEITNSYGNVSSPGYPNDYPRNIYCYWHFHTVLGHKIKLTFHEFDLETHQECFYDSLEIYNSKSENSSSLGIYCGGNEPYSVVSPSNELFMVLQTDAGMQRKGFFATYSTECGGYLRANSSTQIFYSHPRFINSEPYKDNMDCSWRIQSDADSSVKITFLHFEIEYSEGCVYDSLEISEEQRFDGQTNHGMYCGNKTPPDIVSYSDTILIHFQTDESASLKGFAISFMAVEPPDYDNGNDVIPVIPFPGYMKSIYLSSEF